MLNIKKIRPMANYMLVTKEEYDGKETDGGIVIPKGNLKEYQKVVAVGPMVRSIQVGDLVCVNPKRYAVYKYKGDSLKGDIEGMQKIMSYNFNVVKMDGVNYLLITDQDVDFVIEDFEVIPESPIIQAPQQKIIMPK